MTNSILNTANDNNIGLNYEISIWSGHK